MSGMPGDGQLEQRLRQRDPLAVAGDAFDERLERIQERLVGEEGGDECLDGAFPLGVRVGPGGVRLRLAQRFLDVAGQSLGVERPGSDKRLIDQVFLVGVGRRFGAERGVQVAPGQDMLAPFGRSPGQRGETGADVAASLGVMGLRGEEVVWEPSVRVPGWRRETRRS